MRMFFLIIFFVVVFEFFVCKFIGVDVEEDYGIVFDLLVKIDIFFIIVKKMED